MSAGTLPGDDIIPSPSMLYNQSITINAPPSSIFPWLLQLGKSRGGWYAPVWLERILPTSWRATRQLHPEWQNLSVGDRVPDYGFSREDFFVVAAIEAERVLVYRSERYGCRFSWALLLRQDGEGREEVDGGEVKTMVQLRFRGRIGSEGWKRAVIVWAGGKMDSLTTRPMLKGLKERVERVHGE